jgi:hypothetical protein
METILIILGLSGITITSVLFGIRNFIFKKNIEFHKILQSFPLISENRINEGSKTTVNHFTNIQISKELTEFVETKRGDVDEFLAKLENFDGTKLLFKKKEITSFINNIKRLLTSKVANIQFEATLNITTKEITTNTSGKSFEWTAFNYIMVDKIMKDEKQVDKLYICKFLNF